MNDTYLLKYFKVMKFLLLSMMSPLSLKLYCSSLVQLGYLQNNNINSC